jgi:predicted nucleotidyltransferase
MKQPIHSVDRIIPKDIKFADLKALFRPIFEKSPAIKAYLFGSRARGDAAAESDVDLIIVADTGLPFVDRCKDYFGLFQASPAALEMLVYTPEEFRRMLDNDNPFLVKAMEEGKLLYERSGD